MTKIIVLWREILFGRFDIKALDDNSIGRSALTVPVKTLSYIAV